MKTKLFLLCLLVYLSFACNGKRVDVPLDRKEWRSVAESADQDTLHYSSSIKEVQDGLEFSVQGTRGINKRMEWETDLIPSDLKIFPFMVMTYKANWILQGSGEVFGIRVSDSLGKQTRKALLSSDDIISDGRWHTVILKNQISDSVNKIQLNLRSRDSKAYLLIKSLSFINKESNFPEIIPLEKGRGRTKDLIRVDLGNYFNKSYNEVEASFLEDPKFPFVTDGGRYFTKSDVNLLDIPFRMQPDGNNLVCFPSDYNVNDEEIEHFVIKAKRKFVAPISRDDLISVDINNNANEIFFALVADKPTKSPLGSAGWSGNEFNINNVEQFVVELVYDDGTTDFAFPYSLQDQKYIIQRSFGIYAIPANGKLLKRLVFHNRIMGKDMYLAALTINKGELNICPEIHQFPVSNTWKRVPAREPGIAKPYFKHEQDQIIIGNTYIEMVVDLKQSFSITEITNKWLGRDKITVRKGPGLEIKSSGKPLDMTNLELLNVSKNKGAQNAGGVVSYSLNYEGLQLKLNIEISVDDKPEIELRLCIVNSSENKKDLEIKFPVVNEMKIGDIENIWYLFPQYRNYLSNQPGAFNQFYSFSFPMQFYDVFNPETGGGLFVTTREKDPSIMRRYGLVKDSLGVTCTIEYPELYTHINPGITNFCKTVIGVHQGDWKNAALNYREWLSTWYKPVKSQDKQWYKESFWLLCEYMGSFPQELSQSIRNGGFNGWYDPEKNKYLLKDLLDVPKRKYGRYPDILHAWNWVWRRPEGRVSRFGAWGSEGEFELLGGKDNFKKAINDVQKNMGIPVSLYMHFSLADKNLKISKKLNTTGVIVSQEGKPVNAYNSLNFCHSVDEWVKYITDAYIRVDRELNASILYIDQIATPSYFGYDMQNQFNCFADDHGHDVPGNFNLITHDFMKGLRNSVPAKTALYGEFPDVDVNSVFYDCAITYYNVDGLTDMKTGRWSSGYDVSDQNTGDSDVYLNLQRFMMPGMVQLDLPEAIYYHSWHPLKFTFFNGQAVYRTIWLDFETKAEEFFMKANDLKKKYADCFTSSSPEMLVPTEVEGVIANEFPSSNRTLWTLYNKRLTTIRNEVISIPHTEGARYFDVWNDYELTPRVAEGKAYISLELQPQSIGCIIQSVNY